MFFLLRVAFWICIVLVLLPTGKSEESSSAGSGNRVGAIEALSAATAAISDMRHFCERQPDVCTVGGQAAVMLGHRAKDGARMVYEFLSEKLARRDAGSVSGARAAKPAATSPEASSQHTLTPTDLAPVWRGPQMRPETVSQRQT